MELIKWNPVSDFLSLGGRTNRMFNDFFFPRTLSDEGLMSWGWNPAVDIYDDEDKIVIKAELPGVNKKDIEVDIKDRMLTLKGERAADKEVKEDNYYRRESAYGRFERSFTLPADVDPDKVKADYKDGILRVEVPKPAHKKPKQITVH